MTRRHIALLLLPLLAVAIVAASALLTSKRPDEPTSDYWQPSLRVQSTTPEPVTTTEATTTTEVDISESDVKPTTTTLYIPENSVANPGPVGAVGPGACGGDLPPCYVMECESGGNPTVYNASRSGASGKWQMMPGTADGAAEAIGRADLVGTPAAEWDEADQDEAARYLYSGGMGAWHWAACS